MLLKLHIWFHSGASREKFGVPEVTVCTPDTSCTTHNTQDATVATRYGFWRGGAPKGLHTGHNPQLVAGYGDFLVVGVLPYCTITRETNPLPLAFAELRLAFFCFKCSGSITCLCIAQICLNVRSPDNRYPTIVGFLQKPMHGHSL